MPCNYAEKNERRRKMREHAASDPAAAAARQLRRECGGSFGRLPAGSFNALATGTFATERKPKVHKKSKRKGRVATAVGQSDTGVEQD